MGAETRKPLTHFGRGSTIKTLKHLALAALVTAGLLLPLAATRPQLASACDVVGFLSNLGCPFPQPAPILPICSVLNPNVSATADGNKNSYTYDLICDQGTPTIHVVGGYSFDTGAVDESLTTGLNGISVKWTCPHDPWIAPSAQLCPRGTVVTSTSGGQFEITSFDILDRTQPISTQYLDDDQRLVLFQAQLQAVILAAKQAEAAKQAAFLATEVTSVTTELGCGAACFVFGSTPANESTSVTATRCTACAVFSSTPTPTPRPQQPSTYHNPTPEAGTGWPQLTISTGGEAVRSLQYLLQGQGQALGVSGVDGRFGPETSAAVVAFQKAQVPPLTADGNGIVGQQTWLALIVTVQQGSHGPAVQAVKSQLRARERTVLLDGNNDTFGPQTDAAVRAYQQAHSPPADGQVGPQTWKSLLMGS